MAEYNPLALYGGYEYEPKTEWPTVIQLTKPTDLVLGATASSALNTDAESTVDNRQAANLARRTSWLRNQVDGLNAIFGEHLLAANGYQKLPGGLMVQWLTGNFANDENEYSIAFPTSFATCFLAMVSTNNLEINTVNYKDNDQWFQVRGWSATHVALQLQTAGQPIYTDTIKPSVIALGTY